VNIFIIPSWYPSPVSPISGIFFKEQACYIGQLKPDWNISISVWGQGQYYIPARKPCYVLNILKRYYVNHGQQYRFSLESNVHEYYNIALEWTSKILKGNINEILRANCINIDSAIKDFGKIDIIHAHVSYPAGWIAMKLSEKYKIPYVITEHMGPFPFKQFLSKNGDLINIIREPLQKADKVIAVSPSLAERINSFGLAKPVYIPNVVNEEFFLPLPVKEGHNAKSKFTFFTLGGMTPQKGIPDLIAAIKSFIARLSREEQSRVEFIIGGSGEEAERYRLLAEKMGVSQWIRWLGGIDRNEARYYFQHCDCFVLASHHETFGVVFAEAIACGKPVIATRCGGPECIVNESNGQLVEVGNIGQLSEALEHMYKLARYYNADIIREGFLQKFSRSAVVNQLEAVYYSILK